MDGATGIIPELCQYIGIKVFETTICMLIIDFLMKNHHISKLSAVIKIYAYFVIFYFQQSQLRTHVDVF